MSYSEAFDLKQSYFQNIPQAKKGKKLIDSYLNSNDVDGLSNILRWHDDEQITDEETRDRDNIDYFIEYFSVLSLAKIVGFFTEPLPAKLKIEAAYYLGNSSIKKYYSDLYQLHLPEVLLCEILLDVNDGFNATIDLTKKNNKRLLGKEKIGSDDASFFRMMFHKFLRLNNTLIDDDIDRFLGLLDEGVYYNSNQVPVNLARLNRILRSPNLLKQVLEIKNNKTIEYKVVNGLFKYMEFIEAFSDFLKQFNGQKLAQSAYWHYHGYWMIRIEEKLSSSLNAFFKGLDTQVFNKNDDFNNRSILKQIKREKVKYYNAIASVIDENKYAPMLGNYVKSLKARTKKL